MPHLEQKPVEGQKMPLPLERQISSIPRADGSNWVYPSEQQFFNALYRKGKETDEKDVNMIVAIHNEVNERCWDEIKKWESQYKEYLLASVLA